MDIPLTKNLYVCHLLYTFYLECKFLKETVKERTVNNEFCDMLPSAKTFIISNVVHFWKVNEICKMLTLKRKSLNHTFSFYNFLKSRIIFPPCLFSLENISSEFGMRNSHAVQSGSCGNCLAALRAQK